MTATAPARPDLDEAWELHAALVRLENAHPVLFEIPQWTVMRQDAYERFAIAFGLLQ